MILCDVSISCIEHLLSYMYKGEVRVPNDEMTEFLQAAKLLQVQGIDTKDYSDNVNLTCNYYWLGTLN